jgi:hypothetical protein
MLPQVKIGIKKFEQPLIFIKVNSSIKDETGSVEKTETSSNFFGVIQPLGTKDVQIKPQGQWAWQWMMVHTNTLLNYDINDRIVYKDERYKIMGKGSYNDYGFYEYHIVKDIGQAI